MVKPLKILLFPFAVLYDAVTSVRNSLYARGYRPSAEFDLPVIGVGNLAVGGTGKTPMVEYLIRLLGDGHHVVTLSRGYGRTTRGFSLADKNATAQSIGDEPFQIFKKFENRIHVAVGEERAMAIPMILQELPDTQIILLDDAFQHRKVRPSFQIMLTDYSNLFFKDMLLPAGRLRESSRGAARADAIVVTKCPDDIEDENMMIIEGKIREYASCPVFFSRIRYGYPIGIHNSNSHPEKVVLLSGIANSSSFEQYAHEHFQVLRHFRFSDHHVYSENNLKEVCRLAKTEKAAIITTEKDATKLDTDAFKKVFYEVAVFYLPIETEFVKNGKDFDEMLLNVVKKATT